VQQLILHLKNKADKIIDSKVSHQKLTFKNDKPGFKRSGSVTSSAQSDFDNRTEKQSKEDPCSSIIGLASSLNAVG
jgi:hypothetical protein